MDICECIKSLNLSEKIEKEELKRYPCLADAVKVLRNINENENENENELNIEYIRTDDLILILFKAVQELKNEIDILKAFQEKLN